LLNSSAAKGWLRRAERLLDGVPDSPALGFLQIAYGELARKDGRTEDAIDHFRRASEIARRFEERDLATWAAMREGMALVAIGQLDDGWDLMEESCAAAVGGELGAYTTGAVFCNVIVVSCDLADYRRASEWSDAAARWCERESIEGFPGICRVRRAEVLRLVGSLTEAELEVTKACTELRDFSPAIAGEAYAELGEVRLRTGDLAGADEAFRLAHGFGVEAQPGSAKLQLARGNAEAAASSIARRLDEVVDDPLTRAKMLPAQAEIAMARNDRGTAEAVAREVTDIAEAYPTGVMRASAELTAGIASLLRMDPSEAIRHLRRATALWTEVGAPYETASCRLLLAKAYLGDGDAEAARIEAESAQRTMVSLGAAPDQAAATDLIRQISAGDAVRRVVRTFVFTDIVGSTALVEAIGDDAWEDVRRWHDEALRTCFRSHGGAEVDHAGDGFFVAFPDASSAVGCAIEVQRQLEAHRREHGFAPQIRIGLHATEATEGTEGYAGRGVHEAARIGALATGGQILASEDTIDGLDVVVSEPRAVDLKGISGAVRVVAIDWTAG